MNVCRIKRTWVAGRQRKVIALIGVLIFSVVGMLAYENSSDGTSDEPSKETQQARSLYAKGYNSLLDKPRDMIEEFFEKVPDSGVPTENKKVKIFAKHTFAERGIKEAEQAFDQAAKVEAGDAIAKLKPLADRALKAIKKVSTIFRDALNYYNAENYKEDKGSKGKVIFADMKVAATDFRKSIDAISDVLSELEDKETLAELKKFAKDKGPSYLFRNCNFRAKKLLDAIDDPKQFEAQYAEMEQAYKEADTWIKGDKSSKIFKSYMGQVDRFFNNAKKLKRAFADHNKKEIQRNLSQAANAYNTLVSIGDTMYQVEAQGQI